MTTASLATDPPIEITLRRSARARRFSLRVSRLDGRVTLSMPQAAKEAEAMAFARSKAVWLQRIMAETVPQVIVTAGETLVVEGRALVVTPAPVRSVRVDGDALLVPADPAGMARRIAAYLKLLARQRLQAAVDHHAEALGRPYSAITLRDTRSRWGSCTTDGRLMFSWRLILAPPEVLDYVAAHEVAHLAEMNHSPLFWAQVARLVPGYKTHRLWLRRHGAGLHRVSFGD